MVTETTRISYRVREAAQVLGCSDDTIGRLIQRGELKSFTLGRARFITAAEIERLIAEREQAGA